MSIEEYSGCDRLSELPDSLIFDIFKLLPITDVVRTTILSKRWENLWTTSPWLNFSDHVIGVNEFRNFVDGAINAWRGIKILEFSIKLSITLVNEAPSDSEIDSWMHFAMEKKVELMNLLFSYKHVMPQCLYSCSSLKDLTLITGDPQIHGNVQWDQLEKLSIFGGGGFTDNAINQMLSGSPRLKSLMLYLGNNKEHLSIRSTSLKFLNILMCYKRNSASVVDPELRIWTPNLIKLMISGIPYSKCFLTNVSSLTWMSFDIHGPNNLFPGIDFIEGTLSRIFPTIKHIEEVTLSDWCIEVLAATKEKHILSPFPMVWALNLHVSSENYKNIVRVLEMFPELTVLFIRTMDNSVAERGQICLESARNSPNFSLLHLRTLYVTCINDLSLLEHLLVKYAKNPVKVLLKKDKNISRSSTLSMMEILETLE